MDVLGEIMGDKAESIEYSDHNIVVFNIEAEDLGVVRKNGGNWVCGIR